MRLPLSVLLITHNEEHVIARALESVAWADEIIVADAGSTDRTPEICKDASAPWASKIRFHTRAWEGFRKQRNFSLAQASFDWVLVLDADEACTPELRARLEELLSTPGGPAKKAYKVHRAEYFLGKRIHYGIWNPSYQDRFFHRAGVEYINDIHEYPRYPADPGRIHEAIDHWRDFEPEKFLYKMNKYTTIEARARVDAGQRTNVFRLLGAFPAMFLKNYFYYKAYRDGFHGLVISLLEGVSRVVRHVKIWQWSQGR
jgi:glycosyltransferase involved in cell wall biosynthesis